jgi:flagellar biogenesis protein FliO
MRFRRPVRRLRLCESLALGERRFVAVIEFERSRFLVGGTPNSLVLLTRLAEPTPGGADNADPESWAAKDQL